MSRYRVGIDIGGTFTDGVVIDDQGRIDIFKDPSTPQDPSIGLLNTIRKAAKAYGLEFAEFLGRTELLVHGTTVATNTMLQYKGAKVGLITTRGFRDSLEMFRAHKTNLWDLSAQRPPMIVPRYLRVGVGGRIDHRGRVVEPLCEADVRDAVRLFRREGVVSVAVCTLFSYLNEEHEVRIRDIICQEWPEAYVSISAEVLPQIREFERTSTTVVNAYVSPVLARYLRNLQKAVRTEGLGRGFLVTQSNGGVCSAEYAADHGVTTLLSGPSAGAVGGRFFAELLGTPNLIITDMGGTSFDVTLIKDGEYSLTTDGWIAGYRVAIPSIDIHTVGAGGGSIARVDEAGMLKVGPLSAGAVPGPVCYGRGGEEPTTTDANVVLGYLNPDFFLGGEMKLDAEAARHAIRTKIGERLGIDALQAANGMYKVINANMADAIRVVSIEKGHDPRECALVAAGGAGPLHAARLAEEVGIPMVIVPRVASVFCALGMLESDLKHDYVRTFYGNLAALDFDLLNSMYEEMETIGQRTLEEEGQTGDRVVLERAMDMRYVGQHHEVTVSVPSRNLGPADLPGLAKSFHDVHERLFTYAEPENPVEVINLRVTALSQVPRTPLQQEDAAPADSGHALKGWRKAFFEEAGGLVDVPVYDGHRLTCGNKLDGPAIVEMITTSAILLPDNRGHLDSFGNLIVEVSQRGR